MTRTAGWFTLAALLIGVLACSSLMARDTGVPRMGADELATRLEGGQVTVIDVRSGSDWEGSSRKIAGAMRRAPGQVSSWMGDYDKDQEIVLYCA